MNKDINILILEDEVIAAMSMSLDLKRNGFRNVDYAGGRSGAVNYISRKQPDLIIADVSLSGNVSGIDLAAELTGSQNIPVIVISGYEPDDLKVKMEILAEGYFLRKPVITAELIDMIERVFA